MTISQEMAARYAQAVHKALLDDFPRLMERRLTLIVWEMVARQAELASPAFELIVDDPRVANWRLVPDATGSDRWRVQIACRKVRPSLAQGRREQRLNTALRAIRLEGWANGEATDTCQRGGVMGLVWHDPEWEPTELPIDLAGNTRPGFVCVHELENGNGPCGGNVFRLDQEFGRHVCHVTEKA
jgi:hypothetical protein